MEILYLAGALWNNYLKKVHEKWNVGNFISLKYPFMFG